MSYVAILDGNPGGTAAGFSSVAGARDELARRRPHDPAPAHAHGHGLGGGGANGAGQHPLQPRDVRFASRGTDDGGGSEFTSGSRARPTMRYELVENYFRTPRSGAPDGGGGGGGGGLRVHRNVGPVDARVDDAPVSTVDQSEFVGDAAMFGLLQVWCSVLLAPVRLPSRCFAAAATACTFATTTNLGVGVVPRP